MKRTSVNPPNDRGAQFLLDQGEVIEGANRLLHLSGQTAIIADADAEMGLTVKYENDQG